MASSRGGASEVYLDTGLVNSRGWWCQLQKGAWRAEGDAAALSSSRISRF